MIEIEPGPVSIDQTLQCRQQDKGIVIAQQLAVRFAGRGWCMLVATTRLAGQGDAMFVMVNMQVADIKNIETIRGRVGGGRCQRTGGEAQKRNQNEQER